MRKPEESVFPEEIDPLIFYQDASIERKPELAQYYAYLNENNFDAAKDYLAASTLDYYGAWLLNLIENRLYAIEDNMDEYVGEKPNIVIHSAKEPHDSIGIDDEEKFYNWTGDISPYSIYLDIGSEDYISLDNIYSYIGQGEDVSTTAYIKIEDADGNYMTVRQLYNAITPDVSFRVVEEFDDEEDIPEQTYVIPQTGWYKIEVWGAQGGVDPQLDFYNPVTGASYESFSREVNVGGYAVGVIYLQKDTTLYIHVGTQQGGTNAGNNGGGQGSIDDYTYTGYYKDYDTHDVFMIGAGGGGATHVALSSGELSDFENKVNDLIIAAGGGGGDTFIAITNYNTSDPTGYYLQEYYFDGGSGGGFIGGLGSSNYSLDPQDDIIPARDGSNLINSIYDSNTGYYHSGWGGSQTWGGENMATQNIDGIFGEGGSGNSLYYATAGGGGGFYGGAASFAISSSGGGSGWVNHNNLVGRQMVIMNYDQYSYYKEDFKYQKQTDFDQYPDQDEESGFYYNNFDLEDGSTTDHKMPTLTGYYGSYDLPPEASEYATGDGHVRISFSSQGSGVEPTDEELVDMLKMYSSNDIVATIGTGSYSSASEYLESPYAQITGTWFGQTNFTIKFENIKSQPQKCEVYDAESLCQNLYISYDEDAPRIYSDYYLSDEGKMALTKWNERNPKYVYILKNSTSQYSSDESTSLYYNLFDYNGANFEIENPNIISIDKTNTLHALSNGTTMITMIPKEDFVGTEYYQSGDYNFADCFKVLEMNEIEIETYLSEFPWSYYTLFSRANIAFPDAGVLDIFANLNSLCSNEHYSISTIAQKESGYYVGNITFGVEPTWYVSDGLEYEPWYDGQFCQITLPYEWDYDFTGTTFTVSVSCEGVTATREIIVTAYQYDHEFLPGYNEYITLNSVGDTMKLPVKILNYNEEEISNPRFIVKYSSDYNTRVVDIDSYGNITALRVGSALYRIYYNSDDYIDCHFTVGGS